jgi:two-component system, NtrC family, sensor kinase
LVIDDNPDMRGFMKSVLEEEYTILLAENGVNGLESAMQGNPDLIVCDVMMPEMDGYELCRRIRAEEKLKHIPFILVTARVEMAMRLEGLERGADDYLVKPFNIEELLSRVRNLIGSREMENRLARTVEELKATQQELVLSEKMASLGQLMAGISHELNTPFGAIKASNENLLSSVQGVMDNLPVLSARIGPAMMGLFMEMAEEASGSDNSLSTREEREFKKTVEKELDAAGVKNAWNLADQLVSMGIRGNVMAYLGLLNDANGPLIMKTGMYLAGLKRHCVNIGIGIERSAKIIYALKNFTRMDRGGEKKEADLAQGIESVLVLYQHQLKKGVEVVRRIEAVRPVACYPDELNQVWVNLISNAVDAMNHRGTLEIEVKKGQKEVVVSITDSGPGVREEIRNRIFEPFFTTKEAGLGSGLGLDICRKIVEKHSGRIWFESRPGRTTFHVSLPTA